MNFTKLLKRTNRTFKLNNKDNKMKIKKLLNTSIVFATLFSMSTVSMAQDVQSTKAAPAASSPKVGARAGLVSINSAGMTLSGGGYAEYELAKNIILRPSIDYWQKPTGNRALSITLSDLAIAGNVKYVFEAPTLGLKPYLVGGLAMHRFGITTSFSGDDALGRGYGIEGSSMNLGLDMGGGGSYHISTGKELTAELMLRTINGYTTFTAFTGFSFSI